MPNDRADPSASFRFRVQFSGEPAIPPARFTECSGLEFESETFDYKEGGEHAKVHRFPGRFKQTNLTLKRGIALDGKQLWKWVTNMVQGKIKTYNVTVSLWDPSGQQALRTWTFMKAYPIKWSATALTAEQNAIAIETLTLAHQGMMFTE